MSKINIDSLTTREYWEKYYSNSSYEKDSIVKICGYYDNFWEILINACTQTPKNIIEIGAYPGRYLAYLASKYLLVPTGIDYNSDIEKIKKTFEIMGVEDYELIQSDFLKFKPNKEYDLVISNGFIEHFEDFKHVLDLHYQYLKKGGAMLIMIPNMRYLVWLYKILMDRRNLEAHNLNCMSLATFKDFAIRHNLKIEYLDYFGGFPYNIHYTPNLIQKIIFKLSKMFCKNIINPFLNKYPSKLFSSSIIAVLSK